MRLLLVEDDPRMAAFIAKGLREQSFAVDVAKDGAAALFQITEIEYDLVILDIMIPGKTGFEVCEKLRSKGIAVPVLMLTARDSVDDRLTGFECGADDYLTKPFDFQELLARIHALLRRPKTLRPEMLAAADLNLNTYSHKVVRAGRDISLTAKEYALLEYLMMHEGKLVTRTEIAEHVWDENYDPVSNLIDVYVRRLRRKMDEGFAKQLIHTRRGEGYIFSSTSEEDDV